MDDYIPLTIERIGGPIFVSNPDMLEFLHRAYSIERSRPITELAFEKSYLRDAYHP